MSPAHGGDRLPGDVSARGCQPNSYVEVQTAQPARNHVDSSKPWLHGTLRWSCRPLHGADIRTEIGRTPVPRQIAERASTGAGLLDLPGQAGVGSPSVDVRAGGGSRGRSSGIRGAGSFPPDGPGGCGPVNAFVGATSAKPEGLLTYLTATEILATRQYDTSTASTATGGRSWWIATRRRRPRQPRDGA